ncbi:MAG TPA: sugar ABC transporter ATP-binding protein [Bauldia sp.]|nr:sugar ABC transporter ATP-binding protein [Bauldia sp.]
MSVEVPEIVLEVRNVGKRYPGVVALDGLSLQLHAGEVIGLLGENGAGKSTLVKMLSGASRPTSGEILLSGRRVSFSSPTDALRAGIATVFQESMLVPNLTVAANLLLGREPIVGGWFGPIRRAKLRERAQAAIDHSGFELHPDQLVGDLTSAGRQLVELTRALDLDARIVILDEPTSALTAEETAGLFAAVRKLTDAGIAVIYITHRLDEVSQICSRVVVLRDGRLAGTLPGNAPQRDIVQLMVGREVTALFGPRTPYARGGAPLLTVKDLKIGKVGPVNFELGAGEVLGLVGLLGAAQESIGRAIFGASTPDAGVIELNGKPQALGTPAAAAAAGFAFLGADRQREGVVPTMSLRGNLSLCSLPAVSSGPFILSRAEKEFTNGLRTEYGIRSYGVSQPMDTLSGGNQQKALLARWLATKPQVIILEEPTHGIDIGAKEEVYRIIRELAKEGKGIIVVSSDAQEIAGLCDRVIGFNRERAVGELTGKDVTPEAIVSLTVQHGTAETEKEPEAA